jgi:glyoxylase-like metal-dependent hydrolase (beta-lactamase superfamily II)
MPYPGICRITCPTPFPGLPTVHVYVVRGPNGGLYVIDTAMPFEQSFQLIEEGIAYLGCTLTDIEGIVLTHCHPDHFGCSGMLQEASGAPVICHPGCADTLTRMQDPDPERFERMMTVYNEHGRSPEMGQLERTGAGFWQTMVFPKTFETIDEGDTITFAESVWDVYWTPGHEEAHVVFHRRSDGVMLVGDTVLWKITPHIGWQLEPPDPLAQFLDSLEKIAQLDPSFMLPGHGRPFTQGAERARAIASHHALRLRRCLEIVVQRGPSNAIQIARELFDRELFAHQERLALAETLSHVEYLRLRGRISREMVDGIWLYDAPRDIVP